MFSIHSSMLSGSRSMVSGCSSMLRNRSSTSSIFSKNSSSMLSSSSTHCMLSSSLLKTAQVVKGWEHGISHVSFSSIVKLKQKQCY